MTIIASNNDIIKKSDSSMWLWLNCIMLISLCFNCFAFYSIASKVNDSFTYPVYGVVVNAAGLIGGILGFILEKAKGKSALYMQSQKAKGDSSKGLTFISACLIGLSVASTAYNGVTYIDSQTAKELASSNALLVEQKATLQTEIDKYNGTIKRNETEIEQGFYLENGKQVPLTRGMKNTNEWRIKEAGTAKAPLVTQLTAINAQLRAATDNSKPSYFKEYSILDKSITLPKLPIVIFLVFGVFFESMIFIYQRAISFTTAPQDSLILNSDSEVQAVIGEHSNDVQASIEAVSTPDSVNIQSEVQTVEDISTSTDKGDTKKATQTVQNRKVISSKNVVKAMINDGILPLSAHQIANHSLYKISRGTAQNAINEIKKEREAMASKHHFEVIDLPLLEYKPTKDNVLKFARG